MKVAVDTFETFIEGLGSDKTEPTESFSIKAITSMLVEAEKAKAYRET